MSPGLPRHAGAKATLAAASVSPIATDAPPKPALSAGAQPRSRMCRRYLRTARCGFAYGIQVTTHRTDVAAARPPGGYPDGTRPYATISTHTIVTIGIWRPIQGSAAPVAAVRDAGQSRVAPPLWRPCVMPTRFIRASPPATVTPDRSRMRLPKSSPEAYAYGNSPAQSDREESTDGQAEGLVAFVDDEGSRRHQALICRPAGTSRMTTGRGRITDLAPL
jgi:hypothetical protein